MKKILSSTLTVVALFVPIIALAQDYGQITSYFSGITAAINTTFLPLVFALALLVFVWGMFRFFIYGGHNDEEKAKGKSLMIWAIVGFVLMVSIWGVVNLVTSVLGLDNNNNAPELPETPGASDSAWWNY